MAMSSQRERTLNVLRTACRSTLRDEDAAWRGIESILANAAASDLARIDQKMRLERYIYALGLIYTHQTGAMPGFTNGETETRFERFVNAVPAPIGLRITRNLVKDCIRRIDAKRNPRFAHDLATMNSQNAAE